MNKAAGFFFILLALFGAYVLVGLEQQQGFKRGPYTANKPLIKAQDDPEGFAGAKIMGGTFIVICIGVGIYLIRKK